MISMIVAVDKNMCIGDSSINKMPWHIPEDLKYFKYLTKYNPVIMGRKTYDSIGRPLVDRHNFVITKDKNLKIEGAFVFNNKNDTLNMINLMLKNKEIFVIGGGEIYNTFLPLATKIYLTQVDTEIQGDVYFPNFLSDKKWVRTQEGMPKIDKDSGLKFKFCEYIKI